MRTLLSIGLVAASAALAHAQNPATPDSTDPVRVMVGRLNLESYKQTLRGLAQFGDRRQGTKRNRDAVDWIEAQLKSYGCPTERMTYEYTQNPPRGGGAGRAGRGGGGGRASNVGPVEGSRFHLLSPEHRRP